MKYRKDKCTFIIRILTILFLNTAISIPSLAQESGDYYLEQAEKKYQDWDLSGATLDLRMAISTGLNTKTERIRAYQLLAYCYAENGQYKRAVEMFSELLKIEPNFNLRFDPSPTHKVPYLEAKKGKIAPGYEDIEPPEITNLTAQSVEIGSPLSIRIRAKDNRGVARVLLKVVFPGEKAARQNTMSEIRPSIFEFTIPEVKWSKIGYAIAAWDYTGNKRILQGKDGNIFIVNGVKKKKSKTFLWASLAGIIGGSAAILIASQGGAESSLPDGDGKLIDPPPMP